MEIVKASIKDIPIIIDMKMEMFKEVGSISLLQDNAREKIQQVYEKLYSEDKGCHFIVYNDNKIVAIGGAIIKEDVPFCFFKTPYYGYVVDVYCIKEERRKGYATKIMTLVLKWLEEKGVHNVKLKPSEDGRMLYERFGFYNSGEMEKFI